MTTLRQGSRGEGVRRLQEALNRQLQPGPALVIDGDYGPFTRMAVRRLQAANWLVEDGEAGPCTQNVVFGHEARVPILHPVALIPQPRPAQCWAAATAMVTRSTVQAVVARTPAALVAEDGGLRSFADTDDAMTADALFVAAHGLSPKPATSWTICALRTALQEGLLMFDLRWSAKGHAAGAGQPGHMVVVAGIRGDGETGTTLRILDPAPTGKGARCSLNHASWNRQAAGSICRVFMHP